MLIADLPGEWGHVLFSKRQKLAIKNNGRVAPTFVVTPGFWQLYSIFYRQQLRGLQKFVGYEISHRADHFFEAIDTMLMRTS